jgi:hypothetical protein
MMPRTTRGWLNHHLRNTVKWTGDIPWRIADRARLPDALMAIHCRDKAWPEEYDRPESSK